MQWNMFSALSRTIVATGAGLTLYGYIAEWTNFYFFWESRHIGILLLVVAIIPIGRDFFRKQRKLGKSVFFPKLIMGVGIFVLFVLSIAGVALPFTQAYETAKEFVRKDAFVRTEVGEVESIVYIPFGAVQISSGFQGTSGLAQVNVIVKGKKGFLRCEMDIVLSPQTGEWVVVNIGT
jgi:hypothetical protein